jgi:Nif11 domain
MTMKSVVDFFTVVKEDRSLQHRTRIATDIDAIIKIAAEYSCKFTAPELQTFLGKMPEKDLVSAVNPGVGNRLHMNPR